MLLVILGNNDPKKLHRRPVKLSLDHHQPTSKRSKIMHCCYANFQIYPTKAQFQTRLNTPLACTDYIYSWLQTDRHGRRRWRSFLLITTNFLHWRQTDCSLWYARSLSFFTLPRHHQHMLSVLLLSRKPSSLQWKTETNHSREGGRRERLEFKPKAKRNFDRMCEYKMSRLVLLLRYIMSLELPWDINSNTGLCHRRIKL